MGWDPNYGQGAQGAVGGAMAGAAYGSMIPGVGTLAGGLIGGALGGLGGLFGGGPSDERDEYQKLLMDMYHGYQGQQIGPAAQAQQSGLVGNRNAYIGSLEQQAAGNGPSAARGLMQQATDKGMRNATAMAQGAGGRGVNMGAALRNAQGTGAAMQMQNSQNMGIMRNQEQLQAQQMLGGAINAGIGQDNQMSQFNANQMNQMEVARAANALGITQAQMQMLINAGGMSGAPQPGMGTSILAGGAQALPYMLQLAQARKGQPQPQPGPPNVGLANAGGAFDGMAAGGVGGAATNGYFPPVQEPYGPGWGQGK